MEVLGPFHLLSNFTRVPIFFSTPPLQYLWHTTKMPQQMLVLSSPDVPPGREGDKRSCTPAPFPPLPPQMSLLDVKKTRDPALPHPSLHSPDVPGREEGGDPETG